MTRTDAARAVPVEVRARTTPGRRLEFTAVAAAAVVFGAAVLWGRWIAAHGARLVLQGGEPLAGPVAVSVSWGTATATVVAAVLMVGLPALERARFPLLLALSAAATAAWSVALALILGVHRGLVRPLTGPSNILHDIPRVHGVGALLDGFTSHIQGGPAPWATQVAGHPPGALLSFWSLQVIGLGGAAPEAALCIGAGALAVPAALLTVREIASERVARRAMPLLVAAPTAMWIAVSPDAWFLGVTAWGIAALALAAGRHDHRGDVLAVVGGLLLGFGLYLSYGLVLLAPIAIVVVLVRRRVRPLLVGALGVAAVVALFTAGGFWWLDGLGALRPRIRHGQAGARPYGYFLFADLAVLGVLLGPAGVAALARFFSRGRPVDCRPLAAVVVATVVALLLGDVSGLSRGEVERIWLPFMPWLLVATASLPGRDRRGWLGAQLVFGLVLQTLVVSEW